MARGGERVFVVTLARDGADDAASGDGRMREGREWLGVGCERWSDEKTLGLRKARGGRDGKGCAAQRLNRGGYDAEAECCQKGLAGRVFVFFLFFLLVRMRCVCKRHVTRVSGFRI